MPFTEDEADGVVDAIVSALTERRQGLHVSEIESLLDDVTPLVCHVSDPMILLGLAQRSGRVSVARGQYLYLPEWGESRRLTVLESIKRVLEEASPLGLTLENGVVAAELLLGRPIPRSTFSNGCNSLGARFDATTGRWNLIAEEDDADDDEPSARAAA